MGWKYAPQYQSSSPYDQVASLNDYTWFFRPYNHQSSYGHSDLHMCQCSESLLLELTVPNHFNTIISNSSIIRLYGITVKFYLLSYMPVSLNSSTADMFVHSFRKSRVSIVFTSYFSRGKMVIMTWDVCVDGWMNTAWLKSKPKIASRK